MADTVDLYGDLELDASPFIGRPVVLPAPTLLGPAWTDNALPTACLEDPASAGETEENDAVQALLCQLHAAKDSGLYAELELEEDFGDESIASGVEDDVPSGLKRQRLGAPGRGPGESASEAALAAGASDATGFDFEADLLAVGPEGRAREPALRPSGDARGGAPAARRPSTEYWYNPSTQRWEPRDPVKEAEAATQAARARHARTSQSKSSKGIGRGTGCASAVKRGPAPGYKTDLCWQFNRGYCRKEDRCFWAHGQAELRSGADTEVLRKRIIAECVADARSDAKAGACEYPQALVVRLALRFEDKPGEMLANMAEAGLPSGADRRTTVKALMRLCHPDKCHHPEAKKAMQILGPILAKG